MASTRASSSRRRMGDSSPSMLTRAISCRKRSASPSSASIPTATHSSTGSAGEPSRRASTSQVSARPGDDAHDVEHLARLGRQAPRAGEHRVADRAGDLPRRRGEHLRDVERVAARWCGGAPRRAVRRGGRARRRTPPPAGAGRCAAPRPTEARPGCRAGGRRPRRAGASRRASRWWCRSAARAARAGRACPRRPSGGPRSPAPAAAAPASSSRSAATRSSRPPSPRRASASRPPAWRAMSWIGPSARGVRSGLAGPRQEAAVAAVRARTAASSDDLPTPASPATSTTRPLPARCLVQRRADGLQGLVALQQIHPAILRPAPGGSPSPTGVVQLHRHDRHRRSGPRRERRRGPPRGRSAPADMSRWRSPTSVTSRSLTEDDQVLGAQARRAAGLPATTSTTSIAPLAAQLRRHLAAEAAAARRRYPT